MDTHRIHSKFREHAPNPTWTDLLDSPIPSDHDPSLS